MAKLNIKFSDYIWIPVLVLAFSIPFNHTFEFLGVSRTLSFYFGILTVLVGSHYLLFKKYRLTTFNSIFFILILAPVFVSILLHWDLKSQNHQIFLFNYFWCLIITILVTTKKQLFNVMNGFILGLSLLLILALIFEDFSRSNVFGRLSISGKNPNNLSFELLIAISFAIFLFTQFKNNFVLLGYTIIVIIFVYLIVATGSRFPFYTILLISISLIFSSFFLTQKKARYKLCSIAVVLLVSSTIFASLNPGFKARLLDFDFPGWKLVFLNGEEFSILMQDDSNWNLGGRISAWQYSYKVFENNPLYGVGDTDFQKLLSENKVDSPHNFFLYSAVLGGVISLIPALAVFILFIYVIFKYAFVLKRPEIAMIFGANLIVLMMLNIFYLKIYWLAFGLSLVACTLEKERFISES